MLKLQPNAWASEKSSQLTSDHHSLAQMIVLIPKFRHIATLGITWWSRWP